MLDDPEFWDSLPDLPFDPFDELDQRIEPDDTPEFTVCDEPAWMVVERESDSDRSNWLEAEARFR